MQLTSTEVALFLSRVHTPSYAESDTCIAVPLLRR